VAEGMRLSQRSKSSPIVHVSYLEDDLRDHVSFLEYMQYGDNLMSFPEDIMGRLPANMLARLVNEGYEIPLHMMDMCARPHNIPSITTLWSYHPQAYGGLLPTFY